MNKDTAKDYLPLVQALADGKVIQWKNYEDKWEDMEEITFSDEFPAFHYRIKPEPREIWVSHTPGGNFVVFESEYQVEKYNSALGEIRRYREVIE